MDELDVRIVKLEPMRVATFWGFGPEPEGIAFEKLDAWAKPKGYRDDPARYRLFGFNNPDPSPGSPNYGYEVWLTVSAEVEPEDDMRLHDFSGGLYAVSRCPVPVGDYEVIGAAWKELVAWREDSHYQCGTQQWLEESVPVDTPGIEFTLDLYLPLAD